MSHQSRTNIRKSTEDTEEEKERRGPAAVSEATPPPKEKPKPKVDKDKLQPLPYRNYHPVQEVKSTDLPIHFWFYVFVHSSEMDKVLAPFMQLDKRFPTDRRLISIMNKAEVKIRLGDLEVYKSLPRRIIIMQGKSWEGIIRAIFDMEEMLPNLMRYACYPILMDNLTLQFNCTHAYQTAGIVRMT